MVLKKLDTGTKKLFANGKEYFVLDSIPVGRYIHVREAGIKIAEGVDSVADIIKLSATAYDYLNKQKFADAAVKIHNLMTGVNEISTKQQPSAWVIASALIVTSNEDLSIFNNELIDQKINDWSKEGYDHESFFQFALTNIIGLQQLLQTNFQDISK